VRCELRPSPRKSSVGANTHGSCHRANLLCHIDIKVAKTHKLTCLVPLSMKGAHSKARLSRKVCWSMIQNELGSYKTAHTQHKCIGGASTNFSTVQSYMLDCKAVEVMNVQGSQETLQIRTSTSTKHSLTECSTQTCFHMTSVGGTCLTQRTCMQ
jgi:hypothetical protein